jgi:RNA polymerase sigma-70 factor (ECF subfamily)
LLKPFENSTYFESVFKEYFNPLVNFVNKYLNNFENSREVVQMTFVKLWANRSNLEVRTSLKSYLYQTTKNTMIDYIRKNKKIPKAQEIENSMATELFDDHNEYLDPYIIRHAVEKCLKNVKPKAREIFESHKFEGLTYEEIAEYMKISKRTVEDNMSKIMIVLKEELKNHPDFFD